MKLDPTPDEIILRGLAQDPKRLAELSAFEPAWFIDEPVRFAFEAAVAYHRRAAEQGLLRYANRAVIERESRAIVAARIKDDDRKVDSTLRAIGTMLDEAGTSDPVDDHTFREAMDSVRIAAQDEVARQGLLEIVDRFRKNKNANPSGTAKELRDLALRISESEPRASLVGTLSAEAAMIVRDYAAAKKTPGAGFIPTPFPRLNELSSGGGRAGRMWVVAAYAKCGKAAPLDTKVMTPTGWKLMGDIRVGDEVVNPAGGSARVVAVFPQGVKPVYRVTMSDGTSTRCCDEHLWSVNTAQRIARGLPSRVIPLKEIAKHKNRYFVPVVKNAELRTKNGARRRLLDPYLLGALLGDGSFAHRNMVTFSTSDPEMVSAVRAASPAGSELIKISRCDYRFRKVSCERSGPDPVLSAIRRMDLFRRKSGQKIIPRAYLWAPSRVRLALLQGLMDTDGCYTRSGAAEYATVSADLAAGVCFLARSFGCVVRCRTRQTSYTYRGKRLKGQRSFRILISPPPGLPLFRLPRKAAGCGLVSRTPRRGIAKIERIGAVEQQCIALDSENQLYVTDDLIVTHNTMAGKDLIYGVGLAMKGSLVITAEQTKSDVRQLILARHAHKFLRGGIDLRRLSTGRLTKPEERALVATAKDIAAGGLGPISYFQAPSGTTIGDIKALAESTTRKHPVDAIMIDHSLLFSPSERRDSDVARVSEVIRESKQLSLDANGGRGAWVILCHQISREGKDAADKRGGYHLARDFAGSSEAERSADLAMWLWRDEKLTDISEIRMGIAVDRHGPGDVRGWQAYERFTHGAILPIEETAP